MDRKATINVCNSVGDVLSTFVVSQGPQPFIVFADDKIKADLVAHFDINSDGQISYKEAALVDAQSLKVAFSSKTYKSFNE
ncbi:MAG: hypothetical protein IKS85_01330 [Lachnospiraceae bacterium]|nr:hypothetical protein [Lachnospiraceae bacterium]